MAGSRAPRRRRAGTGLGTALASLAEELVVIPVTALAQNFGRDPFGGGNVLGQLELFGGAPFYLNVSLGSTVIAYGHVLVSLFTLGLVAGIAALVVRRRERELGRCLFCASLIPVESRHCAFCGSGVEPGEP